MKLNIEGLIGRTTGTTRASDGSASFFRTSENIAANLSMLSQYKSIENRMFATDYWCPEQMDVKSIAFKLTHILSSETFYDVLISAYQSKDKAEPGRARDTARVYQFGNLFVDEAPYGFTPNQTFTGINNFRTSVGFSNGRDTSTYQYTANLILQSA